MNVGHGNKVETEGTACVGVLGRQLYVLAWHHITALQRAVCDRLTGTWRSQLRKVNATKQQLLC